MTIADLRSSIRDEIAIQRLCQSFAQSRISVSEGEVDAALASQASGSQYHLAHILVGLPEGATPDQIAAAQKKIEGIKGQLDRGEIDFAAAAVRYSDSPNALEGGDLGWRGLNEIPPTFAQAITSMQAGQVIGPVRGPSGFQLLQLVGTRDASAADARTVTQLQARHILVRADEGNDAAAQAKLETLRARIAGGADFATLARENSADTATADKGGELGWFSQDAYGAEFGAQVAALQDGQVSAPFKTQAGWHIVQREGSRQVAAADDNRRQQVRESIGQRKLDEEWDRYLRELRGEAYVEIRLGGDTATPTDTAAPATAPAPANGG
jgi:peptidyl-prolyl cis-trans isomerase SurA